MVFSIVVFLHGGSRNQGNGLGSLHSSLNVIIVAYHLLMSSDFVQGGITFPNGHNHFALILGSALLFGGRGGCSIETPFQLQLCAQLLGSNPC